MEHPDPVGFLAAYKSALASAMPGPFAGPGIVLSVALLMLVLVVFCSRGRGK